jgi:molybdate transport system substrate-binding protein
VQQADGLVRVAMPGAFARLGPQLADLFAATSPDGAGGSIAFAALRPSGLLAQAILAGEPADVYVSANVMWMRRLQRAGLVQHWSTLARNRLCIVAVPGARVQQLADLARPGLRVVAPQAATDPCGRYVEQLWRRAGLLGAMRAKQAAGELVRSVGSGDLPAFLLDGRAQAGMFYLSEARQLDPGQVHTLELPAGQDLRERIRFVVAALSERGVAFVRFLLGPAGRDALLAAGFVGR